MACLTIATELKEKHKGHIWGVYVRSELRGLGVARQLLEAIIAHAADRLAQVNLMVGENNPTAMCLYKELGFFEYGREPCGMMNRANEPCTLILMMKILAA